MNEVLTKSDLIARDVENKKLKRIIQLQADGKMRLPDWYTKKDIDKLKMSKGLKVTTKLTGKARREFLKEAAYRRRIKVVDSFVNYNKPSGRMEEYLNRMGFIMFTKYAKRIQRVIATTSIENPLNVLLVLATEGVLGDVDSIYDQDIFNKSWYNFGISDGDMIPGTNPFSRIMDLVEPPLVRLL
jgi:hypothetical protein